MVLSEDDFTPDSGQNPGYQEVNVEDALKDGTDHQVNIDGEVAGITVEDNKVTITTTDGETQTITASENQTVGVSPSGGSQAYVADTPSGRVYSFPKKSSGSPNEVRSSVQSGVYGGKVSFSPSADQRYGLDVPGAGRGKPDDYFDRDKSGNLVSWKSLEAGMVDYIDLSVEGDLEPHLLFIRGKPENLQKPEKYHPP